MAIYLLQGDSKSPDPQLVRERLAELLKGIPREGNLNYCEFDLSEGRNSFQEVAASALTVPFLGGARVVVAKNVKAVESAFRSKAEVEEGEEETEGELTGAGEAIIRAVRQLEALPKEALLILVEENGALDSRTRFFKELKKVVCVVESYKAMWFDPGAEGGKGIRDVVSYVQEQASRLGLRMDAKMAERFVMLVGPDRGTIIKELEKLSLYAGAGKRLSLNDVEAVVTQSYEAGIFHLVDAIGLGKTAEAIKLLSDLLDRGAAPPYILTMIARQLRIMARIRELLASGARADADFLAERLGESPYTIKKILHQSRTFPTFSYPRILELLMESDVHIKRGTMPPKLALETLITKLAAQNN